MTAPKESKEIKIRELRTPCMFDFQQITRVEIWRSGYE